DNAAHGTVFFMPFYDPSLIPVELVSFNALQRNDDILLTWVTSTETNNKGFFVDRKNKDESWKQITFLNGKGTIISSQTYSYSDKVKKNGNYSYRLRQVDFDGTEKVLSQTEVSFVNLPKTHSLAQNYPNPFNPSTKISYSVGGNSDAFVSLKIFNLLGKELSVIVNEKQSPGSYEIELNLDKYGLTSLSSGVYFYQLNVNNVIQTKKFVVNK
ncbi:MAG: T9SS type A sorting domain-containing protein, partial [Ignavibacteriaceae bacterium]|nr:T9SS type A sorting domain-containing protein [Ignavibacteriaceae bacterium]